MTHTTTLQKQINRANAIARRARDTQDTRKSKRAMNILRVILTKHDQSIQTTQEAKAWVRRQLNRYRRHAMKVFR